MKSLIVPFVAALLIALGCDSDDPKPPPRPLCDPSDPTAGRVAAEVRVVGGLARGQVVMYDNGALYLFVDGQCNYWVNNPNRIWDETHTGVLDVDTATRLGDSLRFNAWDDVSGVWRDSNGGVFDAPVLIFDDAKHAVICVDLCGSADVPATVKTMRDALPVVVDELWHRGGAAESSVRAIAVPAERSPGVPFVDWPLARPITDFVRTTSFEFGEGILETDVASVQALKELRASFLRGDHGAFMWNTLPVTSNGSDYHLYLRDTLPFEDANGVVPFSRAVEPF